MAISSSMLLVKSEVGDGPGGSRVSLMELDFFEKLCPLRINSNFRCDDARPSHLYGLRHLACARSRSSVDGVNREPLSYVG